MQVVKQISGERGIFSVCLVPGKRILGSHLNVFHGSLILNIASENIHLVERFFSSDILECTDEDEK